MLYFEPLFPCDLAILSLEQAWHVFSATKMETSEAIISWLVLATGTKKFMHTSFRNLKYCPAQRACVQPKLEPTDLLPNNPQLSTESAVAILASSSPESVATSPAARHSTSAGTNRSGWCPYSLRRTTCLVMWSSFCGSERKLFLRPLVRKPTLVWAIHSTTAPMSPTACPSARGTSYQTGRNRRGLSFVTNLPKFDPQNLVACTISRKHALPTKISKTQKSVLKPPCYDCCKH